MRISDWSSDVCSSDLSLFLHRGHRLEDGARLHLVDLGIGDAEAATAMTEPGIGLDQLQRARAPLLLCQAGGLGDLGDRGILMRQEPVQLWLRSDERRGGNECDSKCRSWWSQYS